MTIDVDIFGSNQLENSQRLFRSFVSSESEFDSCFNSLIFQDYSMIYGDLCKKAFIIELLTNFYHNDYLIRNKFIEQVLSKTSAISFEEFPILKSRIDLASINGKSCAYEIKTEYDNLTKMVKQVFDYSNCFEYVFVICSAKQTKKVIKEVPNFCGVYQYSGRKHISFKKVKEATLSPNLSSKEMIGLLRKREKAGVFKTSDDNAILEKYTFEKINKIFKTTLKSRFEDYWKSFLSTLD